MKRLLCILMALMIAVLLVPAAVADGSMGNINPQLGTLGDVVISYSPEEAYNEGCLASGNWTQTGTVLTVHLEARAGSGWKFVKWVGMGEEASANPYDSTFTTTKQIASIPVTAYFEKVETKGPEPVVVVEEKKEEPHVHAEVWVEGTPATCTHTGLTDGSKCKWCGEVLQAQKEIPKIDHVYSMWVPNGSGKHYASCLYCGNKIDAACEKVQLPIKSTSGAAITLCPVCGDCNGATATAVKGLKVGEGAPYRGTLRVWNIDAGDNNKYLAVSFDRFGKVMQPEGEVSITLPDDMKGTTAGIIGADGSVTPASESNGTLKLDFTGSQVVVLKGN